MKTIVLRNPTAGGGKALAKWRRLAGELDVLKSGAAPVHDDRATWPERIGEMSQQGDVLVIAAGGDGTVHDVANIILSLDADPKRRVCLGAIGLGSSNDFHKPFSGAKRRGVAIRCGVDRPVLQNVLRITFADEDGRAHIERVIANASAGVVARGNDLFSRRWGPVGVARSLGAGPGIVCASVCAVALQKSAAVALRVDGKDVFSGGASLVGLFVNRHFGGSLSYADQTGVQSEHMGVAVLEDMGLAGRLSLLSEAANGGLAASSGLRLLHATECECTFRSPQLLEMDGEVVRAKSFRADLERASLKVCR